MAVVSVQWTLATPQDWQSIDVTATGPGATRWKNLPKKNLPVGGELIDLSPGWVFALSVDGLVFQGFDHYAVDFTGSGSNRILRVFGWMTDVDDFTDPQALGYRWGEVWTVGAHRPDPRFGGRENTYQTKTVYAENTADMARFFPQETSGGTVTLRPWAEFPTPAADITRHGIWVPDLLFAQHHAVRTRPDWKVWVA